MLGPDTASLTVSDAEMVLLQYMRDARLQPHEALSAITRYARATSIESSSPSMCTIEPPPPAPSYEIDVARVSPAT